MDRRSCIDFNDEYESLRLEIRYALTNFSSRFRQLPMSLLRAVQRHSRLARFAHKALNKLRAGSCDLKVYIDVRNRE